MNRHEERNEEKSDPGRDEDHGYAESQEYSSAGAGENTGHDAQNTDFDEAREDPDVMYCSRCGAKNMKYMNYCQKCGAPLHGRVVYGSQEKDGPGFFSLFGKYLGRAFKSPVTAVRKAKEDEAVSGLIVILVKALVCSLIIMGAARVIGNLFSGLLGSSGYYVSGMIQSGSAMVFFLSFIVILLTDFIIMFVNMGMARAFGDKRGLKQWLASYGSIQVLYGTAAIIAELIMMAGTVGLVIASIINIASITAFILLMYRCYEDGIKEKENKAFYSFLLTVIVTMIVLLIVLAVIIAIFTAAAVGSMGNMIY